MSENMSVKDIRDELILLEAIAKSIIQVYAVEEKKTIIDTLEVKAKVLTLEGSEYIKGLLENIALRIRALNEILIKMN